MDSTPEFSQYVILSLHEQSVFLDISTVNMVLSLPALNKLPDQDPSFQGILNFHGRGIPIYDLLMLLDIGAKRLDIDVDTPVVLCHAEKKEIGLIVSKVHDLKSIDTGLLQPPPSDAMSYVKSIYEDTSGSAWVLDVTELVRHHRLQLNFEVSNE